MLMSYNVKSIIYAAEQTLFYFKLQCSIYSSIKAPLDQLPDRQEAGTPSLPLSSCRILISLLIDNLEFVFLQSYTLRATTVLVCLLMALKILPKHPLPSSSKSSQFEQRKESLRYDSSIYLWVSIEQIEQNAIIKPSKSSTSFLTKYNTEGHYASWIQKMQATLLQNNSYTIQSHKMQDMPNQPLSFFTDPLLLNYITEFLHIKECLLLSALSKKIRFVMQDHFRSIILQNNLYFIPGKSSIHQMHFYFDRCLRIFKYTKENEHKEEVKMGHGKKQADKKKKKPTQEQPESPFNAPRQILKTTVQNPFKFKVVTYFQVGPIFACCLDNKDKAYIFKTHHLISQAQTKEKAIYIEQSDVADIKCKAEKLILVKTYGQAYLYQANKLSKEMQFAKSIINWSLNIPVKHVYSSYSYTLFQLQQPHCSRNFYFKHLFNYNIDLTQQHNEQDNHFMYVIVLNMHNYAYYLVKVTGKVLESVAIGNKEIFIVNQKYQTLVVEMEHIHEGVKQLVTKPFQPFIDKKIIRVDSGYNFFFALERNVEYIEEWTFQEVAMWLRKVGFGDFSKIARAQKLDGKTLKTIQRKYMENVLGLTKLNMQQKLILCIEEVVEGKNEYDQLWVWGKNEYGQLGLISANYIAHPLRIKMDFLQNDRIDKVFCGWQQSFIRTHRGKIYCSLMASERKKKKVVEEKQKEDVIFSDEDDFRKEGRETDDTYHFKNKKRKRTEDYREEFKKVKGHHKRHEEEQRWLQSRSGKAFFVSAYKDYVFIVQCPVQHKFQPTKQKKLRTSKAIIDKIIWSDGLDKSQFKIGIIDKEMGTIEVTPFQIQTFDYKQTSVRYVKKNNVIVWDRELKIDHL